MALTVEQKRACLERVPLFVGCSPESLQLVADATGELSFRAGQHIVQQGQVGNGLYILVSGSARVMQGADVLATMGPGDFFGELSVIDQMPRAASVMAETDATCLALASWDLLPVLEQDPRLSLNMLKELSRRLRAADEQLRH